MSVRSNDAAGLFLDVICVVGPGDVPGIAFIYRLFWKPLLSLWTLNVF